METNSKPRGRPATGLKRNKKIAINFSQEEIDYIKSKAKDHGLSIPNLILKALKNF
ncbi:hypothetical protein [Streptococcus equinus]|uniref:hypothetical protein n=1 Tax=Streptococcus equinus TaxID=1335 RepID=UPI003BF7B667